MDLVVKALTLVLIGWAVRGVLALLHRPRQAKSQMVIWSKLMLVIGILGCSLCLLLAIWGYVDRKTPWAALPGLGSSFLLGGDLIVGYFHCRISYGEQGFTVKNFGESNALILTTRLPGCEAPANPAPSAFMWKNRW